MNPRNSDHIGATPSGDSWIDQVVDYESALANGSPVRSAPAKGLADEDQQRVAYGRLAADALREAFQSPKSNDDPPPRTLGDFRLLREIGRGGMGIVYEAEQISLGRRFALKVLPFASMLDKQQLNRFKNEARAAASLEHPNIVAVHSVGAERGTHFYAMQLVEGQSLAEVIQAQQPRDSATPNAGLRVDQADSDDNEPECQSETQPVAELSTIPDTGQTEYYRFAARLGVQAAEALHYAHANGVVHRDVKPGNLLLDAEGKLYVTDFGLARIEAEQSLTQVGDLLGTLRYMSPEQALAEHSVVDQRTDVYSLGATLYELLVLRPAFAAANRRDLLKQIEAEEPTPMRSVDPKLPVELQTIVLKAMAKDPLERYSSAQQMADDLQAYLEHRPIQAKPLSALQRTQKWALRHQRLVASGAALLLISTLALAASTIAISGEQAKTAEALDQADENLEEANRQKQRAEENFNRAREAVDTYLTRVSEDELLNEPGLQPLRRDLLELALDYYEKFVQQRVDDPLLQLEYADALDRVANIRGTLGDDRQIVNDLRSRALEIRQNLLKKDPNNAEFRNALAESYLLSEEEVGREFELKVARLEKAIELAHPLTAPEHRLTLARGNMELGQTLMEVFLSYGQIQHMERSRELLEKAIAVFEELEDKNVVEGPFLVLPESYQAMGGWHNQMRNVDEARRLDQQALEQLEKLAAAHPAHVGVKQALADSYIHAGDWDRAVETREALARENPLVLSYHLKLAGSYEQLGLNGWREDGIEDEAIELIGKSVAILQRIADDYPEREEPRNKLGAAQESLARTLLSAGRLDEAIGNAESAIEILTETGAYPGELAGAYLLVSRAQEQAGRWDQAIEALENCLQVSSELSDNQLHFQTAEATHHFELAGLLRKTGRIEEAIVEYQHACSGLEDKLAVQKVDGTSMQIARARIAMAHFLEQFVVFLHEIQRDDRFGGALEKAIRNIEPLFDEEATAYFAVVTSSELLRAISGRGSNQEQLADLKRIVQENLNAELRGTRTRLNTVGDDDGPNMEWKRWSGLAFRGYAGLNWQGAEREARRAIERAQGDPEYLLGMAPLLLLAGETQEYRQLCRRLLDGPASDSPELDNHLVRLCGLEPTAAGEADRVLALAKKGMTPPNDELHWFTYGLGRAYYRAGQYEEAVETLKRAFALNAESAKPLICLDLALAHHYWGRDVEAQKWFEQGNELLKDDGLRNKLWHVLAETVVLRHEAEQIFGKENVQE